MKYTLLILYLYLLQECECIWGPYHLTTKLQKKCTVRQFTYQTAHLYDDLLVRLSTCLTLVRPFTCLTTYLSVNRLVWHKCEKRALVWELSKKTLILGPGIFFLVDIRVSWLLQFKAKAYPLNQRALTEWGWWIVAYGIGQWESDFFSII